MKGSTGAAAGVIYKCPKGNISFSFFPLSLKTTQTTQSYEWEKLERIDRLFYRPTQLLTTFPGSFKNQTNLVKLQTILENY